MPLGVQFRFAVLNMAEQRHQAKVCTVRVRQTCSGLLTVRADVDLQQRRAGVTSNGTGQSGGTVVVIRWSGGLDYWRKPPKRWRAPPSLR